LNIQRNLTKLPMLSACVFIDHGHACEMP
jgi:hypothetical protein